MGTNSWFGKGVPDLLKEAQDSAAALCNTAPSYPYTTTATAAQAQMAQQSQMQYATSLTSLTPGMVQQAYNTQYQPNAWFGISGLPDPIVPWEQQLKDAKAEIMKEVQMEFADLHNKLDKMAELLQGLVKVDIPADEIRKALEEPPF